MIRKASIEDVGKIHRLLGHYADKGLLLPRSLSELYDHLRDYSVVEDDEEKGAIIAVCALGICWEGLGEIRSLAVSKDYQGKNIGIRLVENCLQEASSLGLNKVFVLTYVPDFFVGIGFKEIEKAILPHKIWADCLKCPKFPDCDETALIKEL